MNNKKAVIVAISAL